MCTASKSEASMVYNNNTHNCSKVVCKLPSCEKKSLKSSDLMLPTFAFTVYHVCIKVTHLIEGWVNVVCKLNLSYGSGALSGQTNSKPHNPLF